MFGYIAPQKSELLVRELGQYNAYYCGLCASIGRCFGEAARLTLSYDSTYIALLLSGICEGEPCVMRRCGYKPFAKKRLFAKDSDAMRFTAALNVYLAYGKTRDDWHDERKVIALAESSMIKRAALKAKKEWKEMAQAIDDGIAELSRLENAKCGELDAPADAFAKLMRNALISAPYPDAASKRVVPSLAYDIGRWVYLMDAWDDREKDKKSGSYNPFNITGASRERAEFLMNCSLNEARSAYELLDIKSNKGILDNVLYDGCTIKTKRIFGGSNEQSV